MTVIDAMPITEPGIFANEQMLLMTALAAMDGVPKVDTRDWTRIFPIWKVLFSTPLGSPMRRIFLIMGQFHSNLNRRSMWISSFLLQTTVSIIRAPTMRLASEAMPAPAVPRPAM